MQPPLAIINSFVGHWGTRASLAPHLTAGTNSTECVPALQYFTPKPGALVGFSQNVTIN